MDQLEDTPSNTNPSDSNTNPRTRARSVKKIPANIVNPIDKTVTHLTRKQRSIIRRLPDADSMGDIAKEVKCSKGYVSLTYKLPAVQQYLREQLEAAGVTHGLLMKRVREGLDATKEDRAGGERVDYGERRENVKLALEIQGLKNPKVEGGGDTTTNTTLYQIVINARGQRGLDK